MKTKSEFEIPKGYNSKQDYKDVIEYWISFLKQNLKNKKLSKKRKEFYENELKNKIKIFNSL